MVAGTLNRSSSLYVFLETPWELIVVDQFELSCNTCRKSLRKLSIANFSSASMFISSGI